MWWRATRHPSVKGTGVPLPLGIATCSAPDAASAGMHVESAATMLVAQAAPAVASPRRGSQGWGYSSDEVTASRALAPVASDCPHRGCLQVHSLLRPRTFVCRRPHLSAYHLEYSRLLPRMSTARSLGFVILTVRFDSVLMMELLAFAKTTRIGLTAGVLSCLARQSDTLLSLLNSYTAQEPALLVQPLALVSAVGDRLSSFRSFPATLVLQVSQINAP